MQRRKFSREFKVEAVRLVRDRGVSAAQAARDLDVHENVLRKWVKEFAAAPAGAFPGHGQVKPEQLEIDRLRREVTKLKAERDILKKAAGGRVADFHFPVTLSQLRPEVAVMPRAAIDGDRVHLTGVRNFDYRSRNDFTVNYEEREILLSHLAGLDFYVSYFTEGPVGHTFVSFIFDNAPPLSISIETRPEVGEGFAPVASLFKQFELIYVVGDERDLVRVRTNYRGEPVYLYRLNTSAEDARRLLLVYLARINELAEHPEFYSLLTNSCTINIVRYANAAGRAAASKKAFRGEHRSESELKTAQRMSAQRSGRLDRATEYILVPGDHSA